VRITEAIDILHFKIAHGMKKLLLFKRFLSSRHVAKHGQCLLGNNFIKYEGRLTNSFIQSFILAISIAPLQVLYYSKALPYFLKL